MGIKQPTGKGSHKPKRKRLTKKQIALVKAAIKNPDATLTELGTIAGYEGDDKGRANQAHRVLNNKSVQELFREEMEKRPGLRRAALAEKLEEGLNAKVVKVFAHEGIIKDQEEYIDFPTRGTYLALAAKLSGAAVDRSEVSGPNGASLIPEQNPAVSSLTKEDLLGLIAAMDSLPHPQADRPAATREDSASTEKGG